MVEVREIGAGGWRAMRDVRLEALRDAPYAFASTYEREAGFGETDWQRRIAGGGNFLAHAPELDVAPVGIAGGFEAEPGTVELVALWVRPHARGHGVGAALVEAVVGWAWAKGIARVVPGGALEPGQVGNCGQPQLVSVEGGMAGLNGD
jgi:GNAT superfamily N-acetyltransferase